MPDTTAMLNSPILPRMTPTERLMGRFMRAPDHDAGTDAGADKGAEGGDADKGDSGASKDAAGDNAGEGAGGDADGDGATLVGKAAAKAGAGKDGEAGEGDDGGDDKAKADDQGAPETYELKLTAKDDDGKDVDVDLDPALVEAATPVLKDIGLTNEQANKLLPLVPQIQARLAQQQVDDFEKQSTAWAKETKADKEIGGSNWEATEHLMGKALDKFGSPGLSSLVEESRLGNHPDFVRFVRSVGAAMSEDGAFPRGNPTAEKLSKEAVMYPDDMPGAKK